MWHAIFTKWLPECIEMLTEVISSLYLCHLSQVASLMMHHLVSALPFLKIQLRKCLQWNISHLNYITENLVNK